MEKVVCISEGVPKCPTCGLSPKVRRLGPKRYSCFCDGDGKHLRFGQSISDTPKGAEDAYVKEVLAWVKMKTALKRKG